MVDNQEIRIQTVGDSHAWHAWLKIPWVSHKTMGPMTMYTFSQSITLLADKVDRKDIPICFCYGEIDCRYRINDYDSSWEEMIDTLVWNYLKIIDENAKINPDIWLFNVVPPPRRDHLADKGNPAFPFNGPDIKRLAYVKRMNERLKESNYTFIDVYDEYCDEEGFLKMDMSDGHVHIANEKPLMETVDKMLKERGI